jgi:hypothetical protein
MITYNNIRVTPLERPSPEIQFDELAFPGVEGPYVPEESMAVNLQRLLRGKQGRLKRLSDLPPDSAEITKNRFEIRAWYGGGELKVYAHSGELTTQSGQSVVDFYVEDKVLCVAWQLHHGATHGL